MTTKMLRFRAACLFLFALAGSTPGCRAFQRPQQQLRTPGPAHAPRRVPVLAPVRASSRPTGLGMASMAEASDEPPHGRWTRMVSGPRPRRPDWARPWMPTWLVTLRPAFQLLTVLLFYVFHLVFLAQHSVPFPVQLIPNERGHFQSIGLDSLAGMASLAAYYWIRRPPRSAADSSTNSTITDDSWVPPVPKLLSTPKLKESPWKNIYRSKYSRFSSFLALGALFQAYFWTGRMSLWWEDTFYYLANFYPITVAMHRSLCVLFGHLSWIALGGTILRVLPRPQNFFSGMWYSQRYSTPPVDTIPSRNKDGGNAPEAEADAKGAVTDQWVWWTIGGYFVSSWFFNISDFVNQWILPVSILEQAQESVVSQLINPEMNDWLASLVGYIAPCITAPWWEEVLYRGFLLPALILQVKYKWAILWSGIIFSVHHLSPTACIPLAILGWTWSILYTKSGNLLTTILVHAMWNSRIFLGSWLGL